MLPKVIIHNAVSVDGQVVGFPVNLDLYYSLAPEFEEDATLVGSGTILSAPDLIGEEREGDLPLPSPSPGDTRPLLVVCDGRGRVENWHHWGRQPYWRQGLALACAQTPEVHIGYLARAGVPCIREGTDRVDLRRALEILKSDYGVQTVRVDSGGGLNSALLRRGLVSELSILLHPFLARGPKRRPFFIPGESGQSIPLSLIEFRELEGGFVQLRYRLHRQK